MKTLTSSHWIRFLPLFILIGMAHFLIDVMIGIWPIFKSVMHLDVAKAGLIVAVGAFIGEGSQLFFGTFSDRGHRKKLIILGLMIAMASSFLVYASHYFTFFALYLLTCLGSGSFHPCAASLVSSLMPARRALLMTIFAAGGSLGLASSQIAFTTVYAYFGGHTYLMAFPALVVACLMVFVSFPQKIETSGSHPHISLKDFVSFFKNPTLRSLYLSQVANQSILWGTIFILPDCLKALGHSTWICYGGGHFCFILGAASMMIPGGYLADRYSARYVMLYGGVISCILFYFIVMTGGISQTIVLSSLFLLGATLALMNPIAVSLGTKLEPTRTGAVSAFLMGLVWCISEALGPGGVGFMSTLFEDEAPAKALAVLGSLFIIQIYGTLNLPKEVHALKHVAEA